MVKRIMRQRGQKGYVLVVVMILMLVGGMVISAMLKFTGTGILTTKMYHDKTQELYAADAGIEDGRWRIKQDKLPSGYSYYDYFESSGHSWSYDLQTATGMTPNGYSTNVTLSNMWIPTLPVPDVEDATVTLEGTAGNPPKLIVIGSVRDVPTTSNPGVYQIKVNYNSGVPLAIESLGIWLPPGFVYHGTDSNNLDNTAASGSPKMYTSENVSDYKSGQCIEWTFSSYPFLGNTTSSKAEFPGVDLADLPDLISTITFEFDGPVGQGPAAISWIDTDRTFDGDLTYAWDGDQKVFQIVSTAADTTVEAYTIKTELRMMAAAIQGDYYATGNTLMYDSNDDHYNIRDTWMGDTTHHFSSNTIAAESPVGAGNGIPADANVSKALLYWTSWFDDSNIESVFSDSCTNYNNWIRSMAMPYTWGGDGTGQFSAHYYAANGEGSRDLVVKDNILNLDAYKTGRVTISWDQEASVSASTPKFQDDCSTFLTNWNRTTPNSWEINSGSFRANFDTGDSRVISLNKNIDLRGFSEGDITLSWSQWETFSTATTTVWQDRCDTFNNRWTVSSPSYWAINNNRFRAHSTGTIENRRIITTMSNVDLSTCTGGRVTLSWDQTTGGLPPDSSDGLEVQFSNNGGTTWGSYIQVFTGSPAPGRYIYTFPDNTYFTRFFRMRLRVSGFDSGSGSSTQYLYIDNMRIEYTPVAPGNNDGLDYSLSDDGGATWTDYQAFRGTIENSRPPDRNYSIDIPDAFLVQNFRIKLSLVGFETDNQYCNVDSILITSPSAPIDDSDGLDFAFSGDNGAHWSAFYQAFRNDPLETNFSYVIPKDYLTDDFKFTFRLVGFDGTGQTCNINNISIEAMMPDSTAYFKINGNQVYYNGSTPALGVQDIIADKTQVIPGVQGFSYSCSKDVTDLIQWELRRENPTADNLPGTGTYTVGNVNGTKGDNDPNHTQLSHAGWSLIVVYTSPATLGHQLFLYDQFSHAYDADDVNFDLDEDEVPGGTVSGFIVPEPVDSNHDGVPDETNAAKMTIMVGEGDDFIAGDTIGSHYYPGDFVAINADEQYWDATPDYYNIPNSNKLWDGRTTGSNTAAAPNNVWNGMSTVFSTSYDGIDVDTFYVPWGHPLSSGLIKPGDTSAHIDLCTAQDNWNLVYIILSFRSLATTGGSVTYLIQ